MGKTVPRGMYDPEHEGLGDPERTMPLQALYRSPNEVAAERAAHASMSPLVKLLRRTADRALGRS